MTMAQRAATRLRMDKYGIMKMFQISISETPDIYYESVECMVIHPKVTVTNYTRYLRMYPFNNGTTGGAQGGSGPPIR